MSLNEAKPIIPTYAEWETYQGISPSSPEAYHAEEAWKAREAVLLWLESWTTLHWQVDVQYVVDGYHCTLERDGNEMYGPFKGDTYIEAVQAAMDATSGKGALQLVHP